MHNGGSPVRPRSPPSKSTTPLNGNHNGNMPKLPYSKSNDKVLHSTRTKLWWYTITSLLVLAVVVLTCNKSVVDDSPSIRDNEHVALPASSTKKQRPIKQISVLGERNSGTRWTWAHLSGCFNHTLIVKRSLTRYKHWFQNGNTSRYEKDTLVVAQFRNPYDWIEAMRKVPHHAPAHIDLDWKEFCTKTWTTERFGADLNITDKENFVCQEKFKYNDIISCVKNPIPKTEYKNKLRFSQNQPFYEMKNDGSGEPYDNILDMRADKIRNFVHDVKEYEGVRDVWLTQYEYLLARGTKGMLDKIQALTGVKYQCDPFPVQNRRRRTLDAAFVNYLTETMDWEAEALVGYAPDAHRDETKEEEVVKDE